MDRYFSSSFQHMGQLYYDYVYDYDITILRLSTWTGWWHWLVIVGFIIQFSFLFVISFLFKLVELSWVGSWTRVQSQCLVYWWHNGITVYINIYTTTAIVYIYMHISRYLIKWFIVFCYSHAHKSMAKKIEFESSSFFLAST